jgi:nucleoside-diphosphate-sugar epimerase
MIWSRDRSFIYQGSASSVHDPTNLGNPEELSVLEIARKVQALVGAKAPIEFKPLPADDPKVRRPDITRARKLLEWEPKVSLEEGLKRTIDYFRKRIL